MTPELIQDALTAMGKLLAFMQHNEATDIKYNSPPEYPDWYVGLTNDPVRRREEHGQPSLWSAVRVPSFQVAEFAKQAIYQGLTMKSEVHGGGPDSVHVYVFKLTNTTSPTLAEATKDEFNKAIMGQGQT